MFRSEHYNICAGAQVRIEGMLMAAPPLLLCFQISQLLAFYARTVAGLIGARSQLADALAGCCKLARRVFAEQLKARGDRLLRYPPAPPADLSPPPQVGPRLYACCRLYLAASTSDSKTAGAKFRPVTLPPSRCLAYWASILAQL